MLGLLFTKKIYAVSEIRKMHYFKLGSTEVLAVWEQAKEEKREMEVGNISQNGQMIGAYLVEVSNKREFEQEVGH